MAKIGFIGLGRMGYGMSERLLKNGKSVVLNNRSPEPTRKLSKKYKKATGTYSLEEFVDSLPDKKIVWLMLPAGDVTRGAIRKLLPLLSKGDIIIDGANDFYKNAERHAELCAKRGIHFFDCGVSGGIWGLKNGYTLMVGGPKAQFKYIEPFCKVLAPKGGYGYFGPSGSGHYVKSVHNIVEYVYLQGLAEGVELLEKKKPKIDIAKVTSVWEPASVVRSWLLELTTKALNRGDFGKIGTDIGSVTIKELNATKKSVKGYAPAFDAAVRVRRSKGGGKFSLGKRTISAVRNEFGGHKVKKK